MFDFEMMDRELAGYLTSQAVGHGAAKTKQEIVSVMVQRGVFGMGVAYQHAARALCDSRIRLIAQDVPVGTCNEGWYICQTMEEFNAVAARETARAQSIHQGVADLRRAYFSFWARRTAGGAIAGKQEALL